MNHSLPFGISHLLSAAAEIADFEKASLLLSTVSKPVTWLASSHGLQGRAQLKRFEKMSQAEDDFSGCELSGWVKSYGAEVGYLFYSFFLGSQAPCSSLSPYCSGVLTNFPISQPQRALEVCPEYDQAVAVSCLAPTQLRC